MGRIRQRAGLSRRFLASGAAILALGTTALVSSHGSLHERMLAVLVLLAILAGIAKSGTA
jgi:hypothetical protein